MPLQNRVDPFGEVHAVADRGSLMGNRGGRFHQPDRTLGRRRHVNHHWIACELTYSGRRRVPMSTGYTELFFADEPTALAAGHRPCRECRYRDYQAFAKAWAAARGLAAVPRADEIDRALDTERRDGRAKRLHPVDLQAMPDGAIIVHDGRPHLVWGPALHPWSFGGYGHPIPRWQGTVMAMTSPSIVAAIAAGYAPRLPVRLAST